MSDVHGRKREAGTEAIRIRREKEAGKIKEYNALVEKCHHKEEQKEYTKEALVLTTQILHQNVDYGTVWNIRRRILINGILHNASEPTEEIILENKKIYKQELDLFMQLIRLNPKSYWLWNHRRWCLETMPDPNWTAELGLVDKMLTLDARNFHGWNYRRYVIGHLRNRLQDPEEEYKIVKQELDFTTQKINQSFSNYSAWHQRTKLLPEFVANMSDGEKNTVAKDEIDLVKNAVYTDPDDQSAWLYYRWIIGRAPEDVCLLAAFQFDGLSHVTIAFNDSVKLLETPIVTGSNQEELSGIWAPLSPSPEGSILWTFIPSGGAPVNVTVHSKGILTRTVEVTTRQTSKTVPVVQVMASDDVLKKAAAHELQYAQSAEPFKPAPFRPYNDASTSSDWHTLDRVSLLKEEIQTVRELLDLEPDSKWALQTLAHFLNELANCDRSNYAKESHEEAIAIFERLSTVDPYRRQRYQDAKSRAVLQHNLHLILDTNDGKPISGKEADDLWNLISTLGRRV